MQIFNRMMLAKDALEIFIRSLPVNCKFSIVSFGSSFDALKYNNLNEIIDYNDNSKDWALQEINAFDASYGGTEIF